MQSRSELQLARSASDGGPGGSGVATPQSMPWAYAVHHVYAIRSPDRAAWQQALQAEGIQTAIHYPTPLHRLPVFADLGLPLGRFPHAEQAAREVLSLPMFPELTATQAEVVCRAVRRLAGASVAA